MALMTAARTGVDRRTSVRRRRHGLTGLLYATPTALVVVLLFALPLAMAAWMSMNDWPLLGDPQFNFPDNYSAVAQNDLFRKAVGFTLLFTGVTTVIYLTISLGLAMLVQTSRVGVGFFRTSFLMPSAVGLASASLLFYVLYNNDFGPLDDVARAVGLTDGRVEFLTSPWGAFWSTVAMMTWRFAGFYMIIMLTGLQAISVEIYEAARVDGASWWQTLRGITLPLMKPTITLVTILAVTGSLLAFDPFYILTAGGPNNSTVTVVMAMFREAFTLMDLGSAAAISMVLLLALLLINGFQLWLGRRESK